MKLFSFFSSSIGKKLIMATTGLLLLLFLFGHAAGNATLYLSTQDFQEYADQLHDHPLIVAFFSTTILILFLLHVITGTILFLQNIKNKLSRYTVSKRVVKNSYASKTMGYTGLFILFFVLSHVWTFTISKGNIDISELVSIKLNQPLYGIFYLIAFMVLAIHLSHGFFSMLQTFGINHPRYNKLINQFTYGIPIFLLLLFGGIPLIILLS